MRCKGVDLTHSQWLLAAAVADSHSHGRLVPADRTNESAWPTETILNSTQSPWLELDKRLRIASVPNGLPDFVRGLLEGASREIDRLVFGDELPDERRVAFAFPYRTPPLVRKALYNLFTSSHNKLQRSGVEAPIALAIDCVARPDESHIDLTSDTTVLLLTDSPPWSELTGARLSRAASTLRIAVNSYTAVHPGDLARSIGRLQDLEACCKLFHAGDAERAHEIANALEPTSGRLEIVDMGRHAVALGAIRYRGLLAAQQWAGQRLGGVEIQRIVPASVGVLGTNESGNEWFWRRLFSAGEPLHAPRQANLCPEVPAPGRVYLAECTHPSFEMHQWLAQSEWAEAGLYWHDVIDNQRKLDGWDIECLVKPDQENWDCYPRWRLKPTRTVSPEASAQPGASF